MKKDKLRSIYIKRRKEFSKSEIHQKSMMIFELINSNFTLKNKKISLFLTIEKLNEINTFPFLEEIKKISQLVATPKSDFKTNNLTHIKFDSIAQLEINSFGIPEPKSGDLIQPEEFDIVFVPLLTIDKFGNRVGYGKGFYDRFLSKCNPECLFIGLNLFEEIEIIDDLNKEDITLNFCVTPTQIITFNKQKKYLKV